MLCAQLYHVGLAPRLNRNTVSKLVVGERSGAGEAQSGWEYKPFSSVQRIPDPSLLLQLQMSMCVTGASHGYVVSWSRTNMRIWHATYAPDVVAAVDQSVQTVGELYAHSQEQVPTSVSGFPDSLRDALKLLVSRIEHFCSSSSSSVRSVEVPGACSFCAACAVLHRDVRIVRSMFVRPLSMP